MILYHGTNQDIDSIDLKNNHKRIPGKSDRRMDQIYCRQ